MLVQCARLDRVPSALVGTLSGSVRGGVSAGEPHRQTLLLKANEASRVVAAVEASGRPEGPGAYVVMTVEFRDTAQADPGGRSARSLVRIPGVAVAAEHAEALGQVWPVATVPWCGVADAIFTPSSR